MRVLSPSSWPPVSPLVPAIVSMNARTFWGWRTAQIVFPRGRGAERVVVALGQIQKRAHVFIARAKGRRRVLPRVALVEPLAARDHSLGKATERRLWALLLVFLGGGAGNLTGRHGELSALGALALRLLRLELCLLGVRPPGLLLVLALGSRFGFRLDSGFGFFHAACFNWGSLIFRHWPDAHVRELAKKKR